MLISGVFVNPADLAGRFPGEPTQASAAIEHPAIIPAFMASFPKCIREPQAA